MNKNIKILVVEDDGPIRNLISTAININMNFQLMEKKLFFHYQPIIMI